MKNDYAALEQSLQKLAEQWRLTSAQAHVTGLSADNLLVRGHLEGVSETLRLAAQELNALLGNNELLKLPK